MATLQRRLGIILPITHKGERTGTCVNISNDVHRGTAHSSGWVRVERLSGENVGLRLLRPMFLPEGAV